ncbi:MAG TPA: GNAT family N-acetyltransferase, partial [Lentisphaeria bacterium]|nr:GNAT family N-acetyltransferase [Lentisphaeria bacterium]
MPQQLRMIFDCAITHLPAFAPPAGFRVRAMQPGEEEAYLQLRRDGGFGASNWTRDNLNKLLVKTLPNGLFLAVEDATGVLAASAAAEKSDYEDHPELGCLGWVMASEAYRGRQLGKAVSVAAMHHLAQHGYQKFALKTDDWRLPAVNM